MSLSSPSIGQSVIVRSESEILATLDALGCHEGLPFLPEMIQFCGKRFRVIRHANNVCSTAGQFAIYGLQDCVILDTPRCTGQELGGCEMGCRLTWKTAWLELSGRDCEDRENPDSARPQLRGLAIASAQRQPGRYFCQATELSHCGQKLRGIDPRQYAKEMRDNGLTAGQLARYLGSRVSSRVWDRQSVLGTQSKTPVESLQLVVGEAVEVKTLQEIRETLDPAGCNRGLWFDPEMANHCGKQFTVTRIVRRIIDEASGRSIEFPYPAVVLDSLACSGQLRRFCSRGMLNFWREIWLRRVGS